MHEGPQGAQEGAGPLAATPSPPPLMNAAPTAGPASAPQVAPTPAGPAPAAPAPTVTNAPLPVFSLPASLPQPPFPSLPVPLPPLIAAFPPLPSASSLPPLPPLSHMTGASLPLPPLLDLDGKPLPPLLLPNLPLQSPLVANGQLQLEGPPKPPKPVKRSVIHHLLSDDEEEEVAPVSVAAPAQPVAPLAAPGRPASTGMTAPLVLNKLGGVVALAALTGKRMAFPRCKICGADHLSAHGLEKPIEKLNRHHTFRKNLRVLLAGVPWLREQRGVLDVTDAKCAARAQACLLARVPGFKERGLALDSNDFIPRCMAWRFSLRNDQVPHVYRDPHSRSIFFPYFRIYNSQTYAPTPEMAEILGCDLPNMKASGGRKKFRTMDIRDWEPNDPNSKNALNAWLPFTVPPELFDALIDCKEAIDSRRTAAETLVGAFLGPDKPPSDDTDPSRPKRKADLEDTAGSTRGKGKGKRRAVDPLLALNEVLFGEGGDGAAAGEAESEDEGRPRGLPSGWGAKRGRRGGRGGDGGRGGGTEQDEPPPPPKRPEPVVNEIGIEIYPTMQFQRSMKNVGLKQLMSERQARLVPDPYRLPDFAVFMREPPRDDYEETNDAYGGEEGSDIDEWLPSEETDEVVAVMRPRPMPPRQATRPPPPPALVLPNLPPLLAMPFPPAPLPMLPEWRAVHVTANAMPGAQGLPPLPKAGPAGAPALPQLPALSGSAMSPTPGPSLAPPSTSGDGAGSAAEDSGPGRTAMWGVPKDTRPCVGSPAPVQGRESDAAAGLGQGVARQPGAASHPGTAPAHAEQPAASMEA